MGEDRYTLYRVTETRTSWDEIPRGLEARPGVERQELSENEYSETYIDRRND